MKLIQVLLLTCCMFRFVPVHGVLQVRFLHLGECFCDLSWVMVKLHYPL